MSELKTLIKRRSAIKSKLTIFGNHIKIIKSSKSLTELQIIDLECRLRKFEPLCEEFDALQTEIEIQSDEPQTEEVPVEREQFDNDYFTLVATAKSLLAAGGRTHAGSVMNFSDAESEIAFKDPPPPYQANDNAEREPTSDQIDSPPCEVLDLLANCKIDDSPAPEYAEIKDMGLWHSTPLAHRHKSKISLTWVLKENLENAKIPEIKSEERTKSVIGSDLNRHNQRYVNERYRKCKQVRVVGRNEYYHNLRFRSACEEFAKGQIVDSCSDSSEEYSRRRHKHRHRKKKKPRERFGYDIKDLDSFLTEASIDRPGNIPVVIAYPSTLYQTQKECQRELPLPLGTVVNAVFKNEHWLYAQTPHGAEGYVLYAACLPLPILPNRTSAQKNTPCWESSTDIYPRPCGNLTDTEKEQLRGRTRSECRYQRVKKKSACAERDFDTLYLKTKSVSNIDKLHYKRDVKDIRNVDGKNTKRQTLLVVTSDYVGNENTLSVQKGDVVALVQRGETDVDADWFYVRKRDGSQGFIPAKIAGNGYI